MDSEVGGHFKSVGGFTHLLFDKKGANILRGEGTVFSGGEGGHVEVLGSQHDRLPLLEGGRKAVLVSMSGLLDFGPMEGSTGFGDRAWAQTKGSS